MEVRGLPQGEPVPLKLSSAPDGSGGSAAVAANRSEVLAANSTAFSPYCPYQIPMDAGYWQETEDYGSTAKGYLKCNVAEHRCQKPVTNADRVDSIRRALKGTSKLLASLRVPSILYGGSALGMYRCGDVLPWDVDCDVLVDAGDLGAIHEAAFGEPLNWESFHQGPQVSQELRGLGVPGIVLAKKNPCAPFEVVDQKTGFFCDLFTSYTWSKTWQA